MATSAPLYGPARVRRIRIALGVAIALGVLCGIFAILLGTAADTDRETVGAVVLGIVAAATILWAVVTWRLLEAPDAAAKRAVVMTGILLLLFSVPTFPLGILFAILGLLVIFLALTADDGS